MGAMQGQEYRLMRWAVAMRTKKPSFDAFKKAYDEGRIRRLHLLRGTWQLASAEDYGWLLDMFGHRAKKVIDGWMHANGISLDDKEVGIVREVLCRCAEELGSATAEDFAGALEMKGMGMDAHRLSYHIRYAELDGVLYSGELRPMKMTYRLAEPSAQAGYDKDESLLKITQRYFQSRQPATLEDYVWWSGLSIGDCRRGIEMAGSSLHKENWNGREFYLTDSCRTRGYKPGQYLLVPSYDEYLISYKSRDLVLAPEFSHKAHNTTGNFNPIVVHDGIVCGNWKPFVKSCPLDFFLPAEPIPSSLPSTAISAADSISPSPVAQWLFFRDSAKQ